MGSPRITDDVIRQIQSARQSGEAAGQTMKRLGISSGAYCRYVDLTKTSKPKRAHKRKPTFIDLPIQATSQKACVIVCDAKDLKSILGQI